MLAVWEIDSGDSGHILKKLVFRRSYRFWIYANLSLSLFVLRFIADDTHYAFTADDDTLITDFFDGWADFHRQ